MVIEVYLKSKKAMKNRDLRAYHDSFWKFFPFKDLVVGINYHPVFIFFSIRSVIV
jgi:hypothetical protein